MDKVDKQIAIAEISKLVGRAVREWSLKNEVRENVFVHVTKMKPSCYVDDNGITHFGELVTVNIDIMDDEEEEDDEEDCGQ